MEDGNAAKGIEGDVKESRDNPNEGRNLLREGKWHLSTEKM